MQLPVAGTVMTGLPAFLSVTSTLSTAGGRAALWGQRKAHACCAVRIIMSGGQQAMAGLEVGQSECVCPAGGPPRAHPYLATLRMVVVPQTLPPDWLMGPGHRQRPAQGPVKGPQPLGQA